MPELAEVEFGRKVAARVAEGRRVAAVRCARDPIVFDGVSGYAFRKAVAGARVLAVRRRGKQLWFELDRRPWPLFHFGMTGAFRVKDERPLTLASSAKRAEAAWPPRFQKVLFRFEDGGELAMTNKRRLGRIRLREDPEREPPIRDLGFDPYLDLPTPRAFVGLARQRAVPIKALLLDQRFAAGVGNWIADEVLYQARIDPRRRVPDLSDDELKRLRQKLKAIVVRAVEVDADKGRFPKGWLFHARWGKDADASTQRGERIEHMTVAGRTTAWVPGVQK